MVSPTHYTYQITNISNNKKYIGVRSCYGLPDIGLKYFSSSHDNNFLIDQKINPCIYKYEVLEEFSSRQGALEDEITRHAYFDVANNPLFYNRSNSIPGGFEGGYGKNNGKSKPIYQIDKETGNIIQEWVCSRHAGLSLGINLGNLSEAANGCMNSAGGFKWIFKEEYTLDKSQLLLKTQSRVTSSKPVVQLDISSNKIIKRWPSAREATKALNLYPSGINKCVSGNIKSAGGFKWQYAQKDK